MNSQRFPGCNVFPFVFLLLIVAAALLSRLMVSNTTSDSVSLTWEAQDMAFDHFLLEVSSTQHQPLESQLHTIPGDTRSFVLTNLRPNSSYTLQLHALVDGQSSLTLTTLATTGTSSPMLAFVIL